MSDTPSGEHLQVLADDERLEGERIEVAAGTPPPPVTPEEVAAAGGGALAERMRARLKRVRDEDTHDFHLPGWGGDVQVRIRYLDEEEWGKLQRRASEAELVVAATQAVLVRDGDEVLELRWSPDVAQLLGFPEQTPPTRLLAALLGDRPPWMTGLARDVLSWQMGRTPQIEELLGE